MSSYRLWMQRGSKWNNIMDALQMCYEYLRIVHDCGCYPVTHTGYDWLTVKHTRYICPTWYGHIVGIYIYIYIYSTLYLVLQFKGIHWHISVKTRARPLSDSIIVHCSSSYLFLLRKIHVKIRKKVCQQHHEYRGSSLAYLFSCHYNCPYPCVLYT